MVKVKVNLKVKGSVACRFDGLSILIFNSTYTYRILNYRLN